MLFIPNCSLHSSCSFSLWDWTVEVDSKLDLILMTESRNYLPSLNTISIDISLTVLQTYVFKNKTRNKNLILKSRPREKKDVGNRQNKSS